MKLREDYINPEGGIANNDDPSPGMTLSTTSLDAQVKAYLQNFEEDAVNLSEAFLDRLGNEFILSESLRILFEQEEDLNLGGLEGEDEMGLGAEEAEEGALDAIVSDIESDVEKLQVGQASPKIDLEGFAMNVQGLIETVMNKLDFENPIINMAVKYVREQYGDETTDRLIDQFKDLGYKIKIEEPEIDAEVATQTEEEE